MTPPFDRARHLARRATIEAKAVRVMRDAGLTGVKRSRATLRSMKTWKGVMAGGLVAAAELTPDRPALIDEIGPLTFAELDRRTNAIANGLAAMGVAEGDSIAVLCRNHRGFVEACAAAAKLGADVLLLNTGFAGPQAREVLEREGAKIVLADAEYEAVLTDAVGDLPFVLAEETTGGEHTSHGDLLVGTARTAPPPPSREGRITILTSGTTGTPKGAHRPNPPSLPSSAAAIFDRIPLRVEQTTVIAAPLFHAWGLSHLLVALASSATVVLERRFDPERTLATVAAHRARGLIVVPVMIQRMLDLPAEVRARYDTSGLEVVASSGSALPGSLAIGWMDAFGDNLYNLYGSTEVAMASVADPSDLRAAPDTAGRPPLGTVVRLYDDAGQPVADGTVGRIFVGNSMQFDGYTGGGTKERIDGLMSTGDVGWIDEAGRLFVSGRDDDMIVSGGENVFPREVEDLLADHPEIAEAAVLGVPDDEFGQRLAAFVVRTSGSSLDAAAVKAHVKAHLAGYKVPRDVSFVDELPRNQTGKVLKRELR